MRRIILIVALVIASPIATYAGQGFNRGTPEYDVCVSRVVNHYAQQVDVDMFVQTGHVAELSQLPRRFAEMADNICRTAGTSAMAVYR